MDLHHPGNARGRLLGLNTRDMPDYKVFTFEQDSREESKFGDTARQYGIKIHENQITNNFGDMEWIVEASDGDTFLDWYFETGKSWGAKDYLGNSDRSPKPV